MRFDSQQQELLSTILDSLLCYINGRFHIVREVVPDKESERQLRSQLIERYLWEHRELIGDFVRDNPDNLPQSQLDIAQGLAGTLYGTLYLESRGKASAVITHHTGIYTVASPSDGFFSDFPDGLLEMRGAIAPFCGIIVPIPPFAVMGSVSSVHLSHLHDDLRKRGAERPTNDARILAKRVSAWERSYVREGEPATGAGAGPAAGFCKGALSGLDEKERERALRAHANQLLDAEEDRSQVLSTLAIRVDEYPQNLQEALMELDSDWICDIALDLYHKPLTQAMSRQRLSCLIEQHITQSTDDLVLALTWCPDEQFDLATRLMSHNPLVLDDLPPALARHLHPLIPFTFIFRRGTETIAWMPPETRDALARADLASIRSVRRRLLEVRMAAKGMATMCGIVSVSDLYERYRRAVSQPLTRRQFETALDELESYDNRDDYARWHHHGRDYVISVELSDASACARVTRESYVGHIIGDAAAGSGDEPLVVGLTEEDENEFFRLVAQKEDELEQARLSLLDLDRPKLAPELPAPMLHESPIRALMKLDALRALRAFVDAHIPTDQDEYEFADIFCRSIVVSAVLMCETYNETMDIICLYHMEGCEGGTYSDTLGRLVTNAYNALPRWDLNGWSLEQNTERFTGRRRFFNADGTERLVSAGEPCPCGSGKAYGRCCGHLL